MDWWEAWLVGQLGPDAAGLAVALADRADWIAGRMAEGTAYGVPQSEEGLTEAVLLDLCKAVPRLLVAPVGSRTAKEGSVLDRRYGVTFQPSATGGTTSRSRRRRRARTPLHPQLPTCWVTAARRVARLRGQPAGGSLTRRLPVILRGSGLACVPPIVVLAGCGERGACFTRGRTARPRRPLDGGGDMTAATLGIDSAKKSHAMAMLDGPENQFACSA